MTFSLYIPKKDGNVQITVAPRTPLFVLGQNGAGKSSLMHHFYSLESNNAKRISAHRPNYLPSTYLQAGQTQDEWWDEHVRNHFLQPESRWKIDFAHEIVIKPLWDLTNKHLSNESEMNRQVRNGTMTDAEVRSTTSIEDKLNKVLKEANLDISVELRSATKLNVSRASEGSYSIAELSDGERNAMLLCAEVMTAREGQLILIDEPERHLHRSIICPLLYQLFDLRPDCSFVVATHEPELPTFFSEFNAIILKSCSFIGNVPQAFDFEIISKPDEIPDEFKASILGGRQKILFVEGVEDSIDKNIYSAIYRDFLVVPLGSRSAVINSVSALNKNNQLHWLTVRGLTDRDFSNDAISFDKESKQIFSLPFYSAEAILVHPKVILEISKRMSAVNDESYENIASSATEEFFREAARVKEEIIARYTESNVRKDILGKIPKRKELCLLEKVSILSDVQSEIDKARSDMESIIDDEEIIAFINKFPIKNTGIISKVAKSLGLNSKDYRQAVFKAIRDDENVASDLREILPVI